MRAQTGHRPGRRAVTVVAGNRVPLKHRRRGKSRRCISRPVIRSGQYRARPPLGRKVDHVEAGRHLRTFVIDFDVADRGVVGIVGITRQIRVDIERVPAQEIHRHRYLDRIDRARSQGPAVHDTAGQWARLERIADAEPGLRRRTRVEDADLYRVGQIVDRCRVVHIDPGGADIVHEVVLLALHDLAVTGEHELIVHVAEPVYIADRYAVLGLAGIGFGQPAHPARAVGRDPERGRIHRRARAQENDLIARVVGQDIAEADVAVAADRRRGVLPSSSLPRHAVPVPDRDLVAARTVYRDHLIAGEITIDIPRRDIIERRGKTGGDGRRIPGRAVPVGHANGRRAGHIELITRQVRPHIRDHRGPGIGGLAEDDPRRVPGRAVPDRVHDRIPAGR